MLILNAHRQVIMSVQHFGEWIPYCSTLMMDCLLNIYRVVNIFISALSPTVGNTCVIIMSHKLLIYKVRVLITLWGQVSNNCSPTNEDAYLRYYVNNLHRSLIPHVDFECSPTNNDVCATLWWINSLLLNFDGVLLNEKR